MSKVYGDECKDYGEYYKYRAGNEAFLCDKPAMLAADEDIRKEDREHKSRCLFRPHAESKE
jgi:hypothetical protein